MLEKGEYLITIDLKDAYLAVPIAKKMFKFLTFQVGSEHYSFHRLSFGLAFAPYIFTKFLKVNFKFLRFKFLLELIFVFFVF